MKYPKILALLLAVLLALGLFGACANTADQSSAGGETPPADSDAGNADSEPAQDGDAGEDTSSDTPTLDRIRQAGKLVMLTNAAFPPFEYLGANNEIMGVDADIAAVIAEEIGVELQIVDMDFDGIPMAIASGQGDLGIAGMTALDERREVVDFSINYLDTTQLIIVQESNTDITSPDDLSGKSIGVQLGTTGDVFASDIEGAEAVRFKTGPDAGLALANGQVDCVIIDAMPAQMIVDANTGLRLLEEPFTEEQYAIAIAKGNDDLREVVDRVLARLLEDGTIDALIEKHVENM